MPQTHLLSTAHIDKTLNEFALGMGVIIDVLPFTSTSPLLDAGTKIETEKLTSLPVNVVFTSINAINALNENFNITGANWNVYCLDHATKNAAKQRFGDSAIKGTAPNAKELAKLLLQQDDIKKVYFFCGDIRMDTLPVTLRAAGIDVREIVVYTTIATPHQIDNIYDGILFYSPSAVESFFSINHIPEQSVLFAIGETTAAAIGKYATNNIVIGSTPSKHTLITEAVSYFAAI